MKSGKFPQIVLNGIILLLLFMLVYPLAMSIWCSFKTEIGFMYTRWYPTIPLRVKNYSVVFGNIWRYMVNTIFVATTGTARGNMILKKMVSSPAPSIWADSINATGTPCMK